MAQYFGLSSRQVGTAILASCMAAGAIVCGVRTSAAEAPTFQAVSVNRINKGDRLPAWLIREPASGIAAGGLNARLPAPFACDPAFSPVANPGHARVYLRCLS